MFGEVVHFWDPSITNVKNTELHMEYHITVVNVTPTTTV